jgi:hypothetical protein
VTNARESQRIARNQPRSLVNAARSAGGSRAARQREGRSPEIREVAREQARWIKVASAFPAGAYNRRGINKTDWLPIDQQTYDACIDPKDYRK